MRWIMRRTRTANAIAHVVAITIVPARHPAATVAKTVSVTQMPSCIQATWTDKPNTRLDNSTTIMKKSSAQIFFQTAADAAR